MTNFEGQVVRIDQKTAKSNNKLYHVVKVADDLGESTQSFFDWNGACDRAGIKELMYVKGTYESGKFPRLSTIAQYERPANSRQQVIGEVASPEKVVSHSGSNAASSPKYLALKLAVELVQCEQIQVDEKIKRALTAYAEFIKVLDTG